MDLGFIPHATILFRVEPSNVVPASGFDGDYFNRVQKFTSHVTTLGKTSSQYKRSGDVEFTIEADMSEDTLTMLLKAIARQYGLYGKKISAASS